MKFGEHIQAMQRKVDRKFNVPKGIDPGLYHSAQKLAGDKYEPRLIGRGAEHLVFKFEDPKHPDTVYKINYRETANLMSAEQDGPEAYERARQRLDNEIQKRAERLKELRAYLGSQAIPVQKYMIRELPVNIDVIARLAPHLPVDPANLPEKVTAWVTVQRKVDAPLDKIVSMHGHYPEVRLDANREGHRRLYQGVNEIALNQPLSGDTPDDEELQKDWVCHMYPSLVSIRSRAERDARFNKKLKQSVADLINYTQETGRTLDVAGKDNLVMLQGKNNEWQLKLMDPLLNEDMRIDAIKTAISKLAQDKPLKPTLAIQVLNTLNAVRFINCLALIADIPERIHLFEDQEQAQEPGNPFQETEEDIPVIIDTEEADSATETRDMRIPIQAFLNTLQQFKPKQ
ncbi:hypothetical protein GF391_00280 [Candidatus Uhrbacteria bacterium]|nr:hypothetical protein [Candidatus Uhrbacteria bacterium]